MRYLIETRVTDEIDATNHGGTDVVMVVTFEITVEKGSLAETIHRLLMIVVRHGEVGLQRR